jgi:hypothetical protein
MIEYKLSATNTQIIKEFLFNNFEYNWNEIKQGDMLNTNDAFVYLGELPNEINDKTGEVISYLKGLHFDILCKNEIEIPIEITLHKPNNPKHNFK